MIPRVTIGIPVYRRLEYLHQALAAVLAQDYPEIECIVSDNGMNGAKVSDLVARHYSRPYRFRQNAETVDVITHFNQIVDEATGKYFVLFADDDDLSPNFVSELVGLLERHPSASVAIPRQVAIDLAGHVLHSSAETVPEVLSGEEFVKAWCQYSYQFVAFTTNLSRTKEVQACGGYPNFPIGNGNGSDDALLLKLCLGRALAFSTRAIFRKRTYEASTGFSCNYRSLVRGYRQFFTFLDSDPVLLRYAQSHREQYHEAKQLIVKMLWETCFHRWNSMYRERLSPFEWVRSALAMPYIPEYYWFVRSALWYRTKYAMMKGLKAHHPWVPALYRTLTGRAKPSSR